MRLSKEDKELIEILQDPVRWIEATTGEHARSYQAEMLRNPATRKVSRMGRRTGKTWTMCAHMLWYAFTHEEAALIVAAPYENQITLIFDQLRRFVAKSPAIRDSIKYDRRNPQEITFKNRSYIKGFTAGTKSGAAGGSLRGQRANWIYMDEVDYMTDADFDTIYAISLEAPARIGIWVSSTPTGRRGMFWKLCQSESQWTQWHLPSTVNPEWDASMEAELRNMFSTEVAWQHEVLAEFGEETVGVFKKEYIDRARCDYQYESKPKIKALRCMGVDWDKYGAESQILIVEWVPNDRKFQVIHRSAIPKSEFTLHNAVNKIIELNTIYNPDYIYVDRGYGEYQVETLHIYGKEHPETGLERKVKGWVFNQVYEVIDPITKERRNTPIKPFMVNQLVYVLEQDMLMLSDSDAVIWKQMENYQVVRVTATGQPVFTSENEHTVDALMLAVLAFQLEFPQLADIMKEMRVARTIAETHFQMSDPLKLIDLGAAFKKKDQQSSWDEPGSPPPRKVPIGYSKKDGAQYSWGARGSGSGRRPEPRRKSW